MEYKIGNWEIYEKSKYDVRNAFHEGKNYICRGPYCRSLYDKMKLYDKFKDYNLPLLPIVETLLDKDDLFIIYKESTPLKSFENFSTKKIITFIIKMARFHYETGYRLVHWMDNLFILNEEIHFDLFKIEKDHFTEKIYLFVIRSIFNKFNKEIHEKVKFIIEQTASENKDFDNLKKTLLSL